MRQRTWQYAWRNLVFEFVVRNAVQESQWRGDVIPLCRGRQAGKVFALWRWAVKMQRFAEPVRSQAGQRCAAAMGRRKLSSRRHGVTEKNKSTDVKIPISGAQNAPEMGHPARKWGTRRTLPRRTLGFLCDGCALLRCWSGLVRCWCGDRRALLRRLL